MGKASPPDDYQTHASLLERVRTLTDSEGWDLFYEHYWRLIIGFARQRGCSEAASWDVLQMTMLVLMRKMPGFRYDPQRGCFRAYLCRIVANCIGELARRERKYVALADGEYARLAGDLAIAEGSDETAWQQQWEQNILSLAIVRVRQRLEPKTFECFRLYVLEAWTPARVEAVLGLNRNAIYQYRNRVIGLLKKEVAVIEEEFNF